MLSPLKRLLRWTGRLLKRFGMKMLGEIDTPPSQSAGFTATASDIFRNDRLTIGFWNVHKNVKTAPVIAQLASTLQDENGRRNDVLLGLSEIDKLDLAAILKEIKKLTGDNSWYVHQPPSKKFACFSNVPVLNNGEAALGWPVIINLHDLNAPSPVRCAVWFIHMRAPMMTFSPQNVTLADALHLHNSIIDLEGSEQLGASIAIGDFNADPYSDAMLGPDYLNAVMCRKVACKGKRVIHKGTPCARIRPYFYNPMWASLGDQSISNQPGSFYNEHDAGNSNAWHLIDQVLLRPSLIHRIVSGSARVLTVSGKTCLLNAAGKIDKSISDHLPVVISLNK